MSPDIRTLNTRDASYKDPKRFFVRLNTPERESISRVVDSLETQFAQHYQEGYISSQLEQAQHFGVRYERQVDSTSCVYYSIADAFVTLDGINPNFSVEGIKNALRNKNKAEPSIVGDNFDIKELTEVDSNYTQFVFQSGDTQQPEGGFEKLLGDLDSGKVILWESHFSPDLIYGKEASFAHQRVIAGFKIKSGKIIFQIIDPYDAHLTDWTLPELISAALHIAIKRGEDINQRNVDIFSSTLTRVGRRSPLIRTINNGIRTISEA